MGCVGPHVHRIFSINTIKVFSLPYDFINNILFSLDHFIVRIQYIMHGTYKMCVNWLCFEKAPGQLVGY